VFDSSCKKKTNIKKGIRLHIKRPPTNRLYSVILISFVIATMAMLGLMYWQGNQKNGESTHTDKIVSKESDYVGWKTYSDNSLNFSFQYPSTWTEISSTGESAETIATLTSPNIAAETKGMTKGPNLDISVSVEKKSGSTGAYASNSIAALRADQNGQDTSQYFTKKYLENINSVPFTEFDMISNPPYFAAVFPDGDNYVTVDFSTTATKNKLSETSIKILDSFKLI